MSLKEVRLKPFYRSPAESNSEKIYAPCLRQSIKFYRSAGFFSLNGLCDNFDALIELIKRSGEIRIITSPKLNSEELVLIESAMNKEKIVIDSLLRAVEESENLVDEDKLEVLASLIANEAIKMRIVFNDTGIYHEKFGYFVDSNGDAVWFIGSDNESLAGHRMNTELTHVGKSWENYDDFQEIQALFLDAWEDHVPNAHTITLPVAVKNRLLNGHTITNTEDAIKRYELKNKEIIKKKKLYPHQTDALNYFFDNGGCGFLEMATGTGKTFTSCKIIERAIDLFDAFVMIIVPQIDLQTQWQNELEGLGIRTYLLGGSGVGGDKVETALLSAQADYLSKIKCACIATYSTYFEKLTDIDEEYSNNLLFVVDEAHNISSNQYKRLPLARYKLGLSATPIKHDVELSNNIVKYFIESLNTFKFTIEDAIGNGFLSHYEYYPLFVYLDEEEFDEFRSLSGRLAGLMSKKDKTKEDKEKINSIANERSVIVKKARSKIYKLEELLKDHKEQFYRTVIYCGAGKSKEENVDEKLINTVTKMLHHHNISCQQFTSTTTDRDKVLEHFKNDFYDVLVAINCFDEGIDVPQLEKIYIMSSDRLVRQTVQRRGRVLRICKESGKEKGYIYDFVALPPISWDGDSSCKSLVRLEFSRLREYLRLADNKDDIIDKIIEIEKKYSLTWDEEANEYEREEVDCIDEEE